METLRAFVRERASWKETERRVSERAYRIWKEAGCPDGRDKEHWREAVRKTEPTSPPTDIAAVLTVIRRRDLANLERELQELWRFDLHSTDLRGAILATAHLELADLKHANLEGADLWVALPEGVNVAYAYGDEKTRLPYGVERPAIWPPET